MNNPKPPFNPAPLIFLGMLVLSLIIIIVTA